MKETHRNWDPHKLPIPPHRDCLNNAPLANAEVSQREPEEDGHAESVRVNEADGGREQAKVVLEHRGAGRLVWVREVRYDRGRERGAHEEREDERGERPEGPVEVCARHEVRG